MKFDFRDLIDEEENKCETKYNDNDNFLKRKRNKS